MSSEFNTLKCALQCYQNFICNKDFESTGKKILEEILKLTDSEFGFLSHVNKNKNDEKSTYMWTMSNNVWTPETIKLYKNIGITMHNKENTLFKRLLETREIVINNNIKMSELHIPNGYPILKTLMGIPLIIGNDIIGTIILANNPNGYYLELMNKIKPFLMVCISITYSFIEHEKEIKLEKEIKVANAIAETQNNFLAIMSHEIRTPLNGIIGICEILSDTKPLSVEQCEYLEIISNCGKHLKELIDNILDYSKLKVNKVQLNYKKMDFRKFLEDCHDMFLVDLRCNNLDIFYYLDDNIPNHIYVDCERLGQILKNLLSNAIKFTTKGKIITNVSLINYDKINDKYELLISVSDTGSGIPKNKIETIFENFTQLNSTYTRNGGGVGLGLAICKKLVELMDGKIWVESEVGRGSTFNFTVKVKGAEPIPKKIYKINNFSNINILIVDDNLLNRQILFKHLYSWNVKPMMSSSGEEALLFLECGYEYDIIFIDICMPNMDGIELAKRITKLNPQIKLIATSSIGELTSKQSKNFFYKLTKPIKKDKLYQVLISTINNNIPENIKSSIINTKNIIIHDEKILLIEDNKYNQIVGEKILNKLGYNKIDMAENGEIALNLVNQIDYDVILLDVIMPVMDGYTFAKMIKEKNKKILENIIVLTAIVTNNDKEKFAKLGIKHYITKPINVKDLQRAIKYIIK